ncbi:MULTISPECIES: NAD(P)-dependent oxidoreductase [unclassified Rhodococcus (in: high G+C Gram-positive bacteria)]|uniref:NAD(P)-dependent oxidoreductase n=1 Tax=Rhodococcus sp. SJ-3 TaxID=3454628 RepID=UPI003F7B16DE
MINVARSPVVDETALAAAIRSGSVAGAALEVFVSEPLESGSPLFGAGQRPAEPSCRRR